MIAKRSKKSKRKVTFSIVDETYRQTYRDRGNPSHCGDWLATTLEKLTHAPNGEFDMDEFIAILELNGITDWDKYDREALGARGRFRMTCGARLRAKIRRSGVLHTPKGKLTPPAPTRH